jgi:hypothetical protein
MADKQKTRKPKARANGEGTMFQRSSDKLWVGRLPIGYKPDGSIKYRQFTGKKQSDVKAKMDQVKSDIMTGVYTEPNKITVGEWGRQLFCRQFAKLPCLSSLVSLLSMI